MNEKSILYIEDNFENRLLVKRTLEAEGYTVLEAVDGPSGLKVAAESQPDLILLDISLPEMDGYDLARRFADFPHLEGVPVLAVTANVMKGDRERALGAGCHGYIPKPINIDRLPDQIEAALLRARSAQELPEIAEEALTPVPEELEELPRVRIEDLAPPTVPEIDWSDIFEGDAAWRAEPVADGQEVEVLGLGGEEIGVPWGVIGDDGGGLEFLGEYLVETMEAGASEATPVDAEIAAGVAAGALVEKVSEEEVSQEKISEEKVLEEGGSEEEVWQKETWYEEGLEEVEAEELWDLVGDFVAADDEATISELERRLAETLEVSPVGPERPAQAEIPEERGFLDQAVLAVVDEVVIDEDTVTTPLEVAVDAAVKGDEGAFDLPGEPVFETPEMAPTFAEAVGAEILTSREQDVIDEAEAPGLWEAGVDTAAAGEAVEFRLPETSQARLVDQMQILSAELGAEAALLVHGDRVLASAGQMAAGKMERLTEILARGFRAADSVASLLGCERGCSEQITGIGDFLLHALAVDADLVILTAVRDSVPLGAVRLWVKRSAARVEELVHEVGQVPPSELAASPPDCLPT